MRWIDEHGNSYLREDDDTIAVVSNLGPEKGVLWKSHRAGTSASVPEGKLAAENASWSFLGFLERRWAWGQATFGPGRRTKGLLSHIRKELKEIEKDPEDLEEWIDLINLAIDGYNRHGGECRCLMIDLERKYAKNLARKWPDWRTLSEDVAIEHDRSGE